MSYEDVLDYVERDEELVYSNEALSYFEIDQAFEFDRSTIEGGERYGYSDAEFKEYFDGVFSWLRKDHDNAYRNDSEEVMEKLSPEEFDGTFGNLVMTTEPNSPFNHDLFGFCVSKVDDNYLEICFDTPAIKCFRTVNDFQLPVKFFKRLSLRCDGQYIRVRLLKMVDETEIEESILGWNCEYTAFEYEDKYLDLFKSFLESD